MFEESIASFRHLSDDRDDDETYHAWDCTGGSNNCARMSL